MLPLVSLCDFSPCDIPSWTTYTVCHALFTLYDPCFYCIMCTKRHADLYLGHEITSYLKVWSMIHFVHTALFDEVCLTFQQLQYNIWLDGSNSGLCAASGSVNRRKKIKSPISKHLGKTTTCLSVTLLSVNSESCPCCVSTQVF